MSSPSSARPFPRWCPAWALLAIAAAALAAYANSFSGPFVFDDLPTIRDNPALRHLGTAWSAGPGDGLTTGGRPLVAFSLALNYALSGPAVWSYHAVNLGLHLLAAFTLFGLVRRTLLHAPPAGPAEAASLSAFAIALLWVLHPLQTESVTYVVQRAESLMGLCYLLTLYAFARYTEKRAAGWAACAVAACLGGMASKEVMVSAPVIVWLYDRFWVSGSFRAAWRRHGRLHGALAGTWLLLVLLAVRNGDRGRTAGFHAGVVWWRYPLAQFPAIWHYLRLCFWPYPLVFDYGRALDRPETEVLLSALGLLALALLAAYTGWRWRDRLSGRAIAFAALWFFVILAPSSSILPVATEVVAEHRMYLPLAAVIALAVLGLRLFRPAVFLSLTLVLATALGLSTARRNRDYRSELELWNVTAAQCPASADAQYNDGLALAQAGREPEAAVRYAAAVRLDPDFAQAQNNLGLALDHLGRPDEAAAHLTAAVRLRPDLVEAQNDLGNLLLRSGQIAEAVAHYQVALRWQPNYPLTHLNLGLALTQTGSLGEAAAEFERALRLQPNFPEAYFDLGNVHAAAGENDDAAQCYEAALRQRPDFAAARSNLSVVLARRQASAPSP